VSFLYEYEGGGENQVFSEVLPTEVGGKEQIRSNLKEEGSPLCCSHKTDQSDMRSFERQTAL